MRILFGGPRLFGIRTGFILGRSDFRRMFASSAPQQNTPLSQKMEGSFVYVIKGDHNLTKIGISTNPLARIATLRTASPFPIDFSYIAVTPGDGRDIEAAAHTILDGHRCSGEWFDVPPEMAVAAVSGAAFKLGQPLQPLTVEQVSQVLQVVARGGLEAPTAQGGIDFFARHWAKFTGLLAAALMVIVFMTGDSGPAAGAIIAAPVVGLIAWGFAAGISKIADGIVSAIT